MPEVERYGIAILLSVFASSLVYVGKNGAARESGNPDAIGEMVQV